MSVIVLTKDCRYFTKSIISVFSSGQREIEVVFHVIAELLPKVPQNQSFVGEDVSTHAAFFDLYVDCREIKIQVQSS